jgi:hypothetical protein
MFKYNSAFKFVKRGFHSPYRISGVEMDRLKILSDVLNGKLTLKEASHALHLSYRQAHGGYKGVYKEEGIICEALCG